MVKSSAMPNSIINEQNLSGVQFTPEEMQRYSRHLLMPEITIAGQRRLKAARVLCIGAGGLGSPSAIYLAAAGVGTLGLVDFDRVDVSNLQRQILHGKADIGRSKLDSARDRLMQINPNVTYQLHEERFSSANATNLVADYDIVVDGSDNFPTRYLSNDVCVWARKPNVYGSVFRFEGQSTVFAPHLRGPCYRCLFPEPPEPGSVPNCAEAGVLGVLPGIVGLIQAIEAIKLIVGLGEPLTGRLLYFDALKMGFREFAVRRDPECPVCGNSPTITEPIDYDAFCGARGPTSMPSIRTISVHQLKEKLGQPQLLLVDVRETFEYDIARIDGATLMPLGELSERSGELPRDKQIIVMCKSGSRSAQATAFLQQQGFRDVYNLQGGINAWAIEIDPDMPTY
jgi:molybdopterin/thiamine biosynthesis adenylyltransferase/rhodanese-related sulfurtransferase